MLVKNGGDNISCYGFLSEIWQRFTKKRLIAELGEGIRRILRNPFCFVSSQTKSSCNSNGWNTLKENLLRPKAGTFFVSFLIVES